MLPVITLVGRPNVGKSTLFNRLTRSRDALVADYPGLTRDRQYGVGQLGSCPYLIVDTGGLDGSSEGIEALMAHQVRLAIAEADCLLLLLDAREGCLPGDFELAKELRRTGKPLFAVANKTDRLDWEQAAGEFHALGLNALYPIAATEGRGLKSLMAAVCATLPEESEQAPPLHAEEALRVAIVGRPNVGKSTLINRLLGEERVVAADTPGTTRDSLFIPFRSGERDYTLIDTAGMRRRARIDETIEKFSVIKTLQAIEAAHAVLLVLDAQQGIGEQDAHLAAHIIDSGKALVVALNKWDGLSSDQRARVRADINRKLGFLDFAEQHPISALHGSGVGLVLEAVNRAYINAVRDLPTPLLTRLLAESVQEHQPPLVHGHRIKLRYAHQGGRNPPVIVIHGNQTAAVPESYRRYLINRFRKELKLAGTPLRLELRTGSNPYAGKRNILTPSQLRHRQRQRRFVRK